MRSGTVTCEVQGYLFALVECCGGRRGVRGAHAAGTIHVRTRHTNRCLQAALGPRARQLICTLPPEGGSQHERAASMFADLQDLFAVCERTRISIKLSSISVLQRQLCASGAEGEALAMRLRHPPLLYKEVCRRAPLHTNKIAKYALVSAAHHRLT